MTRPPALPPCLLRASAPRNEFWSCSCHRCCFAATAVGRIRIWSGDCNMHAIQHECAMRCIQPHVVRVNPCILPLPLPMNPIACNMKRADGCKHHLNPARSTTNVFSFLSFTRQNQQNHGMVSQPQLCAPRRQIQNRLFCRVSQRVPQANAFFVQSFKT